MVTFINSMTARRSTSRPKRTSLARATVQSGWGRDSSSSRWPASIVPSSSTRKYHPVRPVCVTSLVSVRIPQRREIFQHGWRGWLTSIRQSPTRYWSPRQTVDSSAAGQGQIFRHCPGRQIQLRMFHRPESVVGRGVAEDRFVRPAVMLVSATASPVSPGESVRPVQRWATCRTRSSIVAQGHRSFRGHLR